MGAVDNLALRFFTPLLSPKANLQSTNQHLQDKAVQLRELNRLYDTAVAQCKDIIRLVPEEVGADFS